MTMIYCKTNCGPLSSSTAERISSLTGEALLVKIRNNATAQKPTRHFFANLHMQTDTMPCFGSIVVSRN